MAGVCLILGSAQCLWRDVDAACEIGEFQGVVAAKRAGVLWPHEMDAWVTLHPDRLGASVAERAALGLPPVPRLFAHETAPEIPGIERTTYRFEGQKRSGSSGLFAAKVALEDLGYDRAVLCGIPLTSEEKRLDYQHLWPGASNFRQGFIEALPRINHRLRSMSGWTMQLLGQPTADWLNQSDERSRV